MKLIDINRKLRNEYKNTIVFMKYGNFYRCFYNDAIVMNYIFNYKLNDNRIGFPINIINNIINELERINIDYLIYNNEMDIKYIFFTTNYYNKYLELGISKNNMDYKINELSLSIKNIINKDINNYNDIKRFIDEL